MEEFRPDPEQLAVGHKIAYQLARGDEAAAHASIVQYFADHLRPADPLNVPLVSVLSYRTASILDNHGYIFIRDVADVSDVILLQIPWFSGVMLTELRAAVARTLP